MNLKKQRHEMGVSNLITISLMSSKTLQTRTLTHMAIIKCNIPLKVLAYHNEENFTKKSNLIKLL